MLSRKDDRRYLVQMARAYRIENSGDTKFLTDLILDIDRVLNGKEARSGFLLWDAIQSHMHLVPNDPAIRDRLDKIADGLIDLTLFDSREAA